MPPPSEIAIPVRPPRSASTACSDSGPTPSASSAASTSASTSATSASFSVPRARSSLPPPTLAAPSGTARRAPSASLIKLSRKRHRAAGNRMRGALTVRGMTRRRSILAIAAAGLTATALTAQPAAARPPSPPGPPGPPATASVRLLALNDCHGNLEPPTGSSGRAIDENGDTVDAGGAAYVAAHLKRLRNRDTLTVAQGDLIGATPLISAAYHDEPSVQFLGDIGVTASA